MVGINLLKSTGDLRVKTKSDFSKDEVGQFLSYPLNFFIGGPTPTYTPDENKNLSQ